MRCWIVSWSILVNVLFAIIAHGRDPEYRIIGQKPLSTNQGQPITIQLTDLIVVDDDGDEDIDYPNGFELKISNGSNYTVSGQTVHPHPDFSGNLTVPVKVRKNGDSSNEFGLVIQVIPRPNTPPVITGHRALSVEKNKEIKIEFADLYVTDPDNTYPNGFTMTVYGGANYTVSGRTVKPAQNFTGTLSVPVTVNDGRDNSPQFNVSIQVVDNNPPNTPPVITGQKPIVTRVNTPVTIQFTDLEVSDPDDNYPQGFTMTLSGGSNYTFDGRNVTPATNFAGALSVPVSVNDGEANSPVFNVIIAVSNSDTPNTPPVITGQLPVNTLKNQPVTIELRHLLVSDPDNAYPDGFLLQVFPGSGYTLVEQTVFPQHNFLGQLIVPVKVHDGFSFSEPYDLIVSVVEEETLDIPNVFTPNNDNANDTWKIRGLASAVTFGDVVIRIFDPYGRLVFETKGIDVEWDGTGLNGKPLPVGTYFYTIEVGLANLDQRYKGVVTILR